MRFSAPAILACAAVLASVPACSSDRVAPAHEGDALIGAPIDGTHTFDVGLCGGTLNAAGRCDGDECSGTLVAPNLVLTAQHCVHGIDYAPVWCDSTFSGARPVGTPIRVTPGPSTVVGHPRWYTVRGIYVPGANLCHDDIALLVLDMPIPDAQARPVGLTLSRDVALDAPEEVAIVGRGVIAEHTNLDTGDETSDDGGLARRLLEHVPFVCATDTSKTCDVTDYSSPPTNVFPSPSSYFVIGGVVASGDSGAGVFDQSTFATRPQVLGVAAATTLDAKGDDAFGLVSRLDIHRVFLEQTIARLAVKGSPP